MRVGPDLIVKGWKCFDKDLKCRGFQFEVGKTYEVEGDVILCRNGFHFHEKPEHVFSYYDSSSRVCEVEAKDVITDSDKSVCRSITILKELVGISRFLISNNNADGDGNGYGYGNGYGDGDGYGYGYGDGVGNGYGDGNGYVYGYGYGYGDGYGDGNGYGYGDGDSDGYGDGDGDGCKFIFGRSFRKCI